MLSKGIIVNVKKLTDVELMHEACNSTFTGESKQSLLSIYKSEHSPARTQMFWVTCENIPLFVSTHLLRHHVGSQPFALTHRNDRKGGKAPNIYISERLTELLAVPYEHRTDDEKTEIHALLIELKTEAGRQTPTNLSLLVNAQSLMDMAKLRDCLQSAMETRVVFNMIRSRVHDCDPDLAKMMVKKCVYRNGLCGEPKCCEYNSSPAFRLEQEEYLSNFTQKQRGTYK